MLDPREYPGIFGKTWIDKQSEPLLELGNKRWTRYELVSRVGCGNYKAISILMQALKDLNVRSVQALSKLPPTALAATKGVGTTTLFAAMCLLESEGYDVEAWYANNPTFQALKERQRRHDEREMAQQRRRRRR